MDGRYRENRINTLLKKLEQARQKDLTEYYGEINAELDSITEKIINLDDKEVYPILTIILFVPILLITILSIVKLGFTWRILPFIALLGYLVYFRIHIISLYQAKKNFFERNSLNFIIARINYVQNGIVIKQKRMALIKLMFFIFFPLLLFLVGEWINHPINFIQQLLFLALAIIIGSGGFFLFFNYISPDYEDVKAELAILEEEMKET